MLKSKINTILPIALVLVLPGLGIYSNIDSPQMSDALVAGAWIISSVILYILWYLLWYLWEAKPGLQRRSLIITLLLFLTLVTIASARLNLEGAGLLQLHPLLRLALSSILFLSIQYTLKTQQRLARLLLEKEQLQTEHYRMQLKALRANIDPHFLFNSLNTLRSMVRQQHNNSEEFIISLSDFYRSTLKHNDNTLLPLEEELAVLQSYLFVMKSRNEEAVAIHIETDNQLLGKYIPTLALQIVVENCFKHNSMTSKMPLRIDIVNTNDMYITVSNNLQPKIEPQESSGYGLDLLRKRYELMNIPEGVIVEQTPDKFNVKLKLVQS